MQLKLFVLLWLSKPVINNASELPRSSWIETPIDQQMDLIVIESEILLEKVYLGLSTLAEYQVSFTFSHGGW